MWVRMDVAFALTSCKLRRPYMTFKVTDLGLLLRVTILVAIVDSSCEAFFLMLHIRTHDSGSYVGLASDWL